MQNPVPSNFKLAEHSGVKNSIFSYASVVLTMEYLLPVEYMRMILFT
jgi:hypothetical protein